MKLLIVVVSLIFTSSIFANNHKGFKMAKRNIPEEVKAAIDSCREENGATSFKKGDKIKSENISKMKACLKSRLPKKQK